MHPFTLPEADIVRSTRQRGAPHVFNTLDPGRTALIVVDMQNYFVAPGEQGEVPVARSIVPTINRLAAALRSAGGHVVWLQMVADELRESWSVYHDYLMTRVRSQYRLSSLDKSGNGFPLWHELDVQHGDELILKKRFSAFTQGSSNLESHLRRRAMDTLLIAGTATNACCDATARDAMMLNFKTVMVSDALAAHSDDIHAAALRCFYSNFGDVLTAAEVIGGLAARLSEPSVA